MLAVGVLAAAAVAAATWTPVVVTEDPLVRMPGTQPGQTALEAPNRCLNCHAGYNPAVEPGFNWKGSMMAHSARDFLFWACLTVAGQDSLWAVGTPNAVDICERCHFPKGWLEGRSDPPNASAMTGADFDGVQCDFCHRMLDPFFEDTSTGVREGSDWAGYWDESNASGTPSLAAAHTTYLADATEVQALTLFNGTPLYLGHVPAAGTYTENGSGQYIVAAAADKRASFADAAARHQMLYSRYHKSRYFCSTCHDVSNPVLANLGQDGSLPLTTETDPAYAYYHVERTFSEFMLSAYGQQGGAPGKGPFAPAVFATSRPHDAVAACQDCHMRDVVGVGCNKKGAPVRPDGSVEHPASGQPLHDLTGGNVFVSWVLASAVQGSANFDAVNASLLGQGPAALTLDLTAGEGIDPAALLAGVDRAMQQLELAATIENLSYDAATGQLAFRVQNNTGHKLISGFPEGRRMFLNVRGYAQGSVVFEVNPYDAAAGTLKGLPTPASPPLGPGEQHLDALVYEMHPTSTLTGENETFHFALATGRYKDNRIPPKGFRVADAAARLAEPVWQGQPAPDYYTASEYAGGYDDVTIAVPTGADGIEVRLFYQTTSREYVEFLRDEINGTGQATLSSPTPSGQPAAYVIQSDPFFGQLKAWGDTVWQLWQHNMNVPGAAPYPMARATVGNVGGDCFAPVPTLLDAVPGHQQVVLTWSDEHTADPQVTGYSVYYDQAGKAQLVASVGTVTSFTDSGLTNGQEYCYTVTSHTDSGCESGLSNILCATPANQTQVQVGVSALSTGVYQTSGQGRNKTTVFVETSSFALGDAVVVRATVVDRASGLVVSGATVTLEITGPETATVTSSPSDGSGVAEAVWQTTAPNRNGRGGTAPGSYTATVVAVTGTGMTWDGATTNVSFTVQ